MTSKGFEKRFSAIAARDCSILAGGLKGVEKESLRIDAEGYLAQTAHPTALGSALTNRFITTDYSEALLEFITPAFSSTWEAQQFLCDIHQFTYANLDAELLWTASMPCRIPVDSRIPLARYGTSNVGRMKTIYRRGLGYRYGRQMQTIAGVHFNYSLASEFWPLYQDVLGSDQRDDDFRSEHYLGLVRNFRRFGWLVLYLFGSSPAMCKSFAGDTELDMPLLNSETLYEPYGTSLRMSDLGYSNQNQSKMNISLNSLDAYVRDLSAAIETREPDYEKIGVKVDGEYRQLNANSLQIENEYYSSVRPKRVANSGERPTAALRRGGIEYVEIRSLDTNVDDPAGINQNTMRFVEAFLIYCMLEESPPLCSKSLDETKLNQTMTAKNGRDPEFRLQREGESVGLQTWANEILENVMAIAECLDRQEQCSGYTDAVRLMQGLVAHADETPSARILQKLRDEKLSFFELALSLAEGHRDYFASITPLSGDRLQQFSSEAEESIFKQQQIEASDSISLDEYLATYFSSGT
ncbi:MAG: glutamate--cysteine ligase [Woeseiaceae bacterium]